MSTPKKLAYIALLALALIVLAFGLIIYSTNQSDTLTVSFLDVGQGDAILISQGSWQVLIDGGRDGQLLLERLGSIVPFWDRTIEVIIATHPDQDHIGGLLSVLEMYSVEKLLQTHVQNDSSLYEKWEERSAGIEMVDTHKGINVLFPSGAVLETLYPLTSLERREYTDTNSTSIVMQLAYGETQFLFMGDLGTDEEPFIEVGDIDVLKVGHHGSKYSTGEMFLQRILPEQSVISAGANNRYGHPAPEVRQRLRSSGTEILETSQRGTIQYVCEREEELCSIRSF